MIKIPFSIFIIGIVVVGALGVYMSDYIVNYGWEEVGPPPPPDNGTPSGNINLIIIPNNESNTTNQNDTNSQNES